MEKRSRNHRRYVDREEIVDQTAALPHREKATDRDGGCCSGQGAAADQGSSEEDANAYRVGFCRPPLHSRFKKGEVGNPKGRPKGSRNRHKPSEADVMQAAILRYERSLMQNQARMTRKVASRLKTETGRLERSRILEDHPTIEINGPIGEAEIEEYRNLKLAEERTMSDHEEMLKAFEASKATKQEHQFWPILQVLERDLFRIRVELGKFRRKI